ncbi:glycosyltransferase, partial [Streptomyces galilaeus]|uniref:glycosyltransferase n=1 Tax=Streptomyces galilaeus TaxID=33899 RepID=UPI0038F6F96B
DPEAFGRVSAEAQAMGRPVVATGHGGSREIILDGITGMLVAPGDAGALAAGIRAALDLGAEDRTILAARARDHVAEHFTVEGMC